MEGEKKRFGKRWLGTKFSRRARIRERDEGRRGDKASLQSKYTRRRSRKEAIRVRKGM